MKNKIFSLCIALFLILNTFSVLCFAKDTNGNTPVTDLDIPVQAVASRPLLIIKLSFDANANGENDFDVNNPHKLYEDKSSNVYGEQWCYSDDEYWHNLCFSDEYGSLYDYYHYNSDGKMHFFPANETYGKENDGVVHVVVNSMHPNAFALKENLDNPNLYDGTSYKDAFKAATEYLDLAEYDTNENGFIDADELAVAIIYGGNEMSSGQQCSKYYFCSHAHQVTLVMDNVDGFQIKCNLIRMGEWGNGENSALGTLAHELCHTLGPRDLYDTASSAPSWIDNGYYALMSAGSHNGKGEMGTSGTSPAAMSAFTKLMLGFADETVVSDGIHTVYPSTHENYSVIRINTPDPSEYFLIESRPQTLYDEYLPKQGILIWHIDDDIVNKYSATNAINSSAKEQSSGKRHDPGVALLLNTETKAPFIKVGEIFSAKDYTAKASGTVGLNSYPEEVSADDFNLTIEIVSEFSADGGTQIKVTGASNLAPRTQLLLDSQTKSSINIKGSILSLNSTDWTKSIVYMSKDKDLDISTAQSVEVLASESATFNAEFTGLSPATKYYFTIHTYNSSGDVYKTEIKSFMTLFNTTSQNIEVQFNTNGGVTEAGGRPFDQTVKSGEKVEMPEKIYKEGYTFLGWYTDSSLSSLFDFDIALDINNGNTLTLYAGWEEGAETTTAEATTETTTTEQTTTTENPTSFESTTLSDGGENTATTNWTTVIIVGAIALVIATAVVVVSFIKMKK